MIWRKGHVFQILSFQYRILLCCVLWVLSSLSESCFWRHAAWGTRLHPSVFLLDRLAWWDIILLLVAWGHNYGIVCDQLLATILFKTVLYETDWVIDALKSPALIHGSHRVFGQIVSHFIELWVYFVEVFEIEDDLFGLHLQVVRELFVAYASRCQEVSHMLLKFD